MNIKQITTTFACSLVLCLTGSLALSARAGAIIDPTFGLNGEADLAAGYLAVRPDGKIVSAGAELVNGHYQFAVHRYTADGLPDPGFGNGGVTFTDVTPCDDYPVALALQPDGRIVVAGTRTSCLPDPVNISLVRYLADGTLDLTFGNGGRALISNSRIDRVEKIALQPDGKIVAVGQGLYTFMIARFTSGGLIDRTFGKEGVVIHFNPLYCQYCSIPVALTAVSVEGDGGLLVAGWMSSSTDRTYFVVGRFGTLGRLEYLHPSDSNQADGAPTFRTIARLPNGKILAIGDQVARFTPDGYLDPTFAQNKALAISRGRTGGNGVVTPDGKILQVGKYYTLNTSCSFVRLFGPNGATIGQVNYYGSEYSYQTALVQPDGKLLVLSDKMRRYISLSSLASKPADFDGDLISDVGIFRPGAATWWIQYSTAVDPSQNGPTGFGIAGDVVTPGHYVFNERPSVGKLRATTSSIATYRPSTLTWYVSTPTGTNTYAVGAAGETPIAGDYDGDGVDDLATFQNGNWRIVQSSDGTQLNVGWGTNGDLPVPGDYDYDGSTDIAVFRPSTGTWYVWLSSTGATVAQQFGLGSDRVVPGDYDGDGRTDFAVYRPANGTWYVRNSHDGSFQAAQFGIATDRSVPGDYDGDGRTDLAVFRDGVWYILRSSDNTVRVVFWGQSGDVPLTPGFTAQ
jgi:uncharacterized delta-60 repeat protein